MRMYEARQNKALVSRTIFSSKQKMVRQCKIQDNRTLHQMPSIIQLNAEEDEKKRADIKKNYGIEVSSDISGGILQEIENTLAILPPAILKNKSFQSSMSGGFVKDLKRGGESKYEYDEKRIIINNPLGLSILDWLYPTISKDFGINRQIMDLFILKNLPNIRDTQSHESLKQILTNEQKAEIENLERKKEELDKINSGLYEIYIDINNGKKKDENKDKFVINELKKCNFRCAENLNEIEELNLIAYNAEYNKLQEEIDKKIDDFYYQHSKIQSNKNRHIMAGVSDVNSREKLLSWTIRHELGHAVDNAIGWYSQKRYKENRFGGWIIYKNCDDAYFDYILESDVDDINMNQEDFIFHT